MLQKVYCKVKIKLVVKHLANTLYQKLAEKTLHIGPTYNYDIGYTWLNI